MAASAPRITELRIEGLRSIEKLVLPLDGLTVLIGENGTGKSSILEALELLRRAATPNFMNDLGNVHGGLLSLLRQGARELTLGVRIEDETLDVRSPVRDYNLTLARQGSFDLVLSESVTAPVDPAKKSAGALVELSGPARSPTTSATTTNGRTCRGSTLRSRRSEALEFDLRAR